MSTSLNFILPFETSYCYWLLCWVNFRFALSLPLTDTLQLSSILTGFRLKRGTSSVIMLYWSDARSTVACRIITAHSAKCLWWRETFFLFLFVHFLTLGGSMWDLRLLSSRLWRYILWQMFTDVSQKRSASMFRVEEYKQSVEQVVLSLSSLLLLVCSGTFLSLIDISFLFSHAWLILPPWWWRRHVPQKRQ